MFSSTASGENAGQVTFAICGFGSRGCDALTGIEVSVESHVMALAAEESHVCGGKSVNLNDFSREALE